jgi:nicotinate-nucleotide pyrophosphorylase (carboxylating)
MLHSELERFIIEDIGESDDSTAIIPDVEAVAVVIAKEDCIVSGLSEAAQIFQYFGLEIKELAKEGEYVNPRTSVMRVRGQAKGILRAERLALNFLGRMSGISTLTHECVRRAKDVRIACTRKTTPGFRSFEKRAVQLGGGDPHRFNLSGAVMIKDNHLKLMGVKESIQLAKRQASFTKKIEIEVEDLDQLVVAAESGADIVMLDNMDPLRIKEGIEILKKKGLRDRLILEASGGINLENIGDYASTGVDVISLGALTRMAQWTDFSLEIEQYI